MNTKTTVSREVINCCVYCGSIHIKGHGVTSAGNQRFVCRNCGRTFTENHDMAVRYSHLDKDMWLRIIRGLVSNYSLPIIARDTGLVQSTVWLCKQKICSTIREKYRLTSNMLSRYSGVEFRGKAELAWWLDTYRNYPTEVKVQAIYKMLVNEQ